VSRVISARPRVSSAAAVFDPYPRPSTMPAAIAITFLSAPASSTPTTSVLEYARKAGSRPALHVLGDRELRRGHDHGRRLALHDLGGEGRARERRQRPPGASWAATSLMRSSVSSSSPFVVETIARPAGSAGPTAR
jgi:hypothetical protein